MDTLIPYEREVFYYETDQMSIIHHSNYIRWMEEARVDFLDQIGLTYSQLEEAGILIPVLSVSCDYKQAFRYGDVFQIKVFFEKFTGVRFRVSYEIVCKRTGQIHAVGSSEHCFATRELVPLRMKKEYPELYQKLSMAAEGILDNKK